VRAASDAVADIICWSNDIVSYRKEENQSSADVLSLPTVLAHQHGMTEQQALDHCAVMLEQRIADYYAAERPLLASGNPGLIRFAADLRHWIAGNLEWSYETGRYKVSAP
jgi:5-epi-alpha-selinene synthase